MTTSISYKYIARHYSTWNQQMTTLRELCTPASIGGMNWRTACGLYSGVPGLFYSLLMTALAEPEGSQDRCHYLKEIFPHLLTGIRLQVKAAEASDVPTGVFNGVTGVIYLCTQMSLMNLCPLPDLVELIYLLDGLGKSRATREWDLMGGLAGEVVCLARTLDAFPNLDPRILAERTNLLFTHTMRPSYGSTTFNPIFHDGTLSSAGLAHGAAGVAMAFAAAARHLKDDLCSTGYRAALVHIERWVRARAQPDQHAGPDIILPKRKLSWCASESGIALAMLEAAEADLPTMPISCPPLTDLGHHGPAGLCHGIAGEIDISFELDQKLSGCELRFSELLSDILSCRARLEEDCSLMLGISGVLYTAARLQRKERTGCVLRLANLKDRNTCST